MTRSRPSLLSSPPAPDMTPLPTPGSLERALIDAFQRDFPLAPEPFAAIGEHLAAAETEVLAALARLLDDGTLSRVGPVFAPHRAGTSTLAAMTVPPERLAQVAELVNGHEEVNHNYEREHRLNLWFVIAAPTRGRIDAVIAAIERDSGLAVLELPLLAAYHIDLGFPVEWN